jgi:Tfp pilus assembly protein PilO
MKKPDKQQWIILLVAAVVSVGFGVFRYVPIVRQKVAIREQLEQQNQIIDEICSLSVLIPELKNQKRQLEKQLLPFDQKVPQGRNLAPLWQQVAEVMNECGLTDQLVQPGVEIKSPELCSIPLTIECKGSMQQIFAFFRSLEEINRLIRIEQVTLDRGTDLESGVKLKAQANVYYQPDG